MYEIRTTRSYRKAYKRVSRHENFRAAVLDAVVDALARGETLGPRHRDHQLTGSMREFRECHVERDILLVYQCRSDILVLVLVDIGSHSSLFG